MIGYDSQQVERKAVSILRILSEPPHPLGARPISRQLTEAGVALADRALR